MLKTIFAIMIYDLFLRRLTWVLYAKIRKALSPFVNRWWGFLLDKITGMCP